MRKQNNDAGFTAEQRKQVQKEINSFKVNIDRVCFYKTKAEKYNLKMEKRKHKEFNELTNQ